MITTFLRTLRNTTVILLLAFTSVCFAQSRQIAITMDDLPFVGEQRNYHLNMIIETAKALESPITGFIIGKEVNDSSWETLKKFRESGLTLGSHTYSHINLNKVNTKAYIQEIDENDKLLQPVISYPKYFRYPYLAMGNGAKKEAILQHLADKHYQVAPITIDSKDFIFNQLLMSVPEASRRDFMGALKSCYLNFIWQQTLVAEEHNRLNHKDEQAQILLIHANLLNAYTLPDIISLYRQNGYTIVTLEDALKSFTEKYRPRTERTEVVNEAGFLQWD